MKMGLSSAGVTPFQMEIEAKHHTNSMRLKKPTFGFLRLVMDRKGR
jgi:hypothetical protein